jgi:hypothetical protein
MCRSLPVGPRARHSSGAARLAAEGPARSRHSCSRSSPTSSAVEGILRSCGAGSQREMTFQTHPTSRRPPPSPSWSSGDDSAHRRPDARARDRDCRGRDLPPPCPACGRRRWAIRWAKPSRLGPYQAQPGASVGVAIWPDLQAFLCLKRRRTPCLTRERSQLRNPPRPSSRRPANAGFLRSGARFVCEPGRTTLIPSGWNTQYRSNRRPGGRRRGALRPRTRASPAHTSGSGSGAGRAPSRAPGGRAGEVALERSRPASDLRDDAAGRRPAFECPAYARNPPVEL